jgi:hypothetical protein
MGTVVWQAFSNDYIIYDENIPRNVHGQTIVLLVCDYDISWHTDEKGAVAHF